METIETLKNVCEEVLKEFNSLNDIKNILLQDIELLKSEKQSFELKVKNIQKEFNEYKSQIDEKRGKLFLEVEMIKNEISRSLKEIEEVSENKKIVKIEIEKLTNEKSNLLSEINELTTKLEDYRKKAESAYRAIKGIV